MGRILELCNGAEAVRPDQYWTQANTSVARGTTIIRPGGSVASWTVTGGTNGVYFPAAEGEFYFSTGIYIATATASVNLLEFRDIDNNLQVAVRYNLGSGTIDVQRGTGGASGATIASGAIPVTIATWFLLEGHVVIDNATGVFTTKINGVQDVNFSGDTQGTANATVTNWRANITAGTTVYYDDILFDDAVWIGDSHLIYLYPTGAGYSTQWTPSAGANWQCVDERPCSDADYNSAASGGLIDGYGMVDYTGTDLEIIGVWALACATSTVGGEQMKVGFRTGGSNYVSAAQALATGTSQIVPGDYHATNPATAAAWIDADLDGIEAVIESV